MKTNRSGAVCILIILALTFLPKERICFGKDEGPEFMNAKVSDAEDSWSQGDHAKYYSKAAAISKEIRAQTSKANQIGPASKLLGSLLSKQANPKEIGTSDLETMQALAAYLASHDEVALEDRRSTAILLCKYLGKVRKEKVPNFKPARVFANVAPPAGVPGMPGMNPDAIKDPVAKAKYLEAIRENAENGRQNWRQHELRDSDTIMYRKIKSFLPMAYKASDLASQAFVQCMKDAGVDNKERKEIEEQLNGKNAETK